MKRYFLLILAAVVALASQSSCNKTDETYKDVYPGITLYTYGWLSSEVALDGVSVAMRLGLLLNEIEEYNAENSTDPIAFTDGAQIGSEYEPDWSKLGDSFEYKLEDEDDEDETVDYNANVKEFLLGYSDQVYIQKSGTVYTLTFGGDVYIDDLDSSYYGTTIEDAHVSAIFDNMMRNGSFVIDTKGVMLEETDENTQWTIYSKLGLTYANTGDPAKAIYKCENIGGTDGSKYTLYKSSTSSVDLVFNYAIADVRPNYNSTTNSTEWNMEGSVTLNNYDTSKGFTVENTYNNYYLLDIYGTGTPLVSTNTTSSTVAGMIFETTSPIKYKPSTKGLFTKYSCEIETSIPESLISSTYPYNIAYMTFYGDGDWTMEYGDTTYYGDVDDDY